MTENPYAWNVVNPSLCYGRDGLLNELLSGLPGSPRYSFGLAGGRRMGKTTLLRRVEAELQAGTEQWRAGGLLVIPLYVDGLVLPRPLSASDVWGYLLNELRYVLPEIPVAAEPVDFTEFKLIAQPVLTNLEKRPRIIVILDEIEPIAVCDWAMGFLAHWRALLSNTPGLSEYFTVVFAGAHELSILQRDVGSPLKDIMEWRSLRNLEFEDACRLMQEPIQHEWPPSFLERVYLETGGHPMLLQYFMQHVCMNPFEEAEQYLDSIARKFEHERSWQLGEWWGRYCTTTAQRVYKRLPDDGSATSLRTLTHEFGLGEANEALEVLQHIGLAEAEDDGFAFRYTGEMFRRWYRIYGTLAETPQHDPMLYERLSAVQPRLADKYLSAWQIYQTDLPNYSGAVSEIRDTFTLLLDEIAPEDQVMAAANFRLEPNRERPTRRQRLRYAARQRYSRERTQEITSDFDLLETTCDQLAQLASGAYRSASGMAHTTATRERAYRTLKQWDSILAQLVPDA
jgi:hypothetical protein